MQPIKKLTFLDRCHVKWAVRQGWPYARIAITLAVPFELVCSIADDESSTPEIPIL